MSGLKMPVIPKAEGQQTLEEAFKAGAIHQEAKEIKKKALMAKEKIEVNILLFDFINGVRVEI